jgi:hypothetical protein
MDAYLGSLFARETSLQRLQNFPVLLPGEFLGKLLNLLDDRALESQ